MPLPLADLLHSSQPLLSNESFICVTQKLTNYPNSLIHLTLMSDMLITFLSQRYIPVTVAEELIYQNADVFVLSMSSNSLLFHLFQKPFNRYGVYIICLERATPKEVETMIFSFWTHKIYDVTVIANGTAYETVTTGCNREYSINIRKHHESFKTKNNIIPKDCPLRINWIPKEPYFIGYYPNDGLEYFLLKLVVTVGMEKSILWVREEFKGHMANGTWVGALGNLQDIAGGGFIMSSRISKDFKLTYPHFFDSYKWHISPMVKITSDISLEFNTSSYSVTIIFFIYISIYFLTMSGEDKTYNSPALCVLNVWRIALGQPIRKTPNTLHMRILFIAWAIFQMHFSLVYSGILTKTYLTKYKMASDQRENIENFSCITSNIEQPNSKDILPISQCDLYSISKRMSLYKNFSLLAGEEQMNFLIKRHKLPIKRINPRYVLRYNTFVLPKTSVLLEAINDKLHRIVETGIYYKLRTDVYSRYFYFLEESEPQFEEINLALLYFILLIGWGVGVFALAGEILNFKFQKRKFDL